MPASNPWSNMKVATTPQTDEEFLQALINSGSLASSPAQPAIPAPAAKKLVRAAQPAAPAKLPAQQSQPGAPYASPGTATLPYQGTEDGTQDKTVHTQQRAYLLDPAEIADSLKKFGQIPDVQELKKGNQDYKDLIAMQAAQGGQADLSGLMAMADVASDNRFNMRGGYKVPADKAKELLANMDKAQDNQRDLTKELIALSNARKAGMDTSILQTLLTSKLAEGFKTAPPPRPSSGNPVNNYDKWVRNTDSAFKKIDDTTGQIAQIKKEVSAGNPIDDARIAILRATMDAHGRPNMAEVQMEGGNRALLERVPQAWERLATGKLTDANRQLYMDSFDTILQYLDLERKATGRRQKSMAKNYGVSDSAARDRLPDEYVNKAATNMTPATTKAAPTSSREKELKNLQDSNEQILKFIQSQKGGQ